MDKIKLEILGLSASHSQSGSFALVLGEETGTRRLPIIIGMFEAQAIAIEMEKIISKRPMTHDLFKSFALSFDIDVYEVIISDLKEGVFYAKIICSFADGSNYIELDARPSDAVAIGIRFGVPIYAYNSVLKEAGIELSDVEEELESLEPLEDAFAESEGNSDFKESDLKRKSVVDLETLMQAAIDAEDYEQAAKIRDEIQKRGAQ